MTATLSPTPTLYYPNTNNTGAPAAGFKLFTYIANTNIKQNTWTDSTQSTVNDNPLPLDANGFAAKTTSSAVFIDPTLVYKYVWAPANDTDPPSSPIRTIDNIRGPLDLATLTQALIGLVLYPRTAAEIAAGVTPVNYAYAPGDLRRYGATPGSDITTALASAAAQAQQAGGASIYISSALGTACTVTAGVTFDTAVTVYGDGYQKSQFSTASDITIFTLNVGASQSILADFQITGKGAGATLPGILFTNANQCRMERVRVASFGVGVRYAQGANSCYLNCVNDCRFESSITINLDAQKNTNQLRLQNTTLGGAPSQTALKLIDCTDCVGVGLNIEGVSIVGIDIDNPSGGTFAGSGHVFIDPHFETATSAGDIRIGNTALVNGVTIVGGYTNPIGSCDCGINIGIGGCNGLRVVGHNINAGYSGGVGYIRLTGTLTNESISLGGLLQYSQYIAANGKVNYADRGTLLLDGPTFLDPSAQDQITWAQYKINSGSVAANKNYYGVHVAARIENSGAMGAGSKVYALRATLSNAVGGSTRTGSAWMDGDLDLANGSLSLGQSATAVAIVNGNTITTTHTTVSRVAPAGAVTAIILQAGTISGQLCTVINEAIAANTVTFAAAGTSFVADGVASVIAGLNCRTFVWDSTTALWYPSK